MIGHKAFGLLFVDLSTPPFFIQHLEPPHAFEPIFGVVKAEKQVALIHHRVVHEGVSIVVHLHEIAVGMTKEHHAAALSHSPARVEVELRHGCRVAIEVEKQFLTLTRFGFLVIHINLSADGFVTVSHRGSPL